MYKDRIQKDGGKAILQELPDDQVGSGSAFLFGFYTEWQASQLREYVSLLMVDSTHKTCYALEDSRKNAFLYTIVVKHDKAGRGIPAAFMVTSSETQRPLAEWLKWLKYSLPLDVSPIFMIDCSRTEMAAISTAFPNPQIRLCHWHMLRAVRSNANSRIKLEKYSGNTSQDKALARENNRLRNSAHKGFKVLMKTKTTDDFNQSWRAYEVEFQHHEEWLIFEFNGCLILRNSGPATVQ